MRDYQVIPNTLIDIKSLESIVMPNPLSRVKPDASFRINNAGARELSQRPELAILVAEAINSWSQVEGFHLGLFVELFGGSDSLATDVYHRLSTSTAKAQALEAAIDNIPDEKIRKLTKAVTMLANSSKRMRDKLAHHIWGISPQLPNALL